MKKIYLLLILFILLLSPIQAADPATQLPQNAKLISQSGTQLDLFITLIDLDTNELVIVRYGLKRTMTFTPDYELKQVIRTGIKMNPMLQGFVQGQDSPPILTEEKEEEEDE